MECDVKMLLPLLKWETKTNLFNNLVVILAAHKVMRLNERKKGLTPFELNSHSLLVQYVPEFAAIFFAIGI